ncbi:helix-turn-helix domain-containing protein [Clostridioides difficile]|nr:helix-turn-helix domain-containing protein [Clostridioides difficile]
MRAEAGRDPHDKALQDLVGELSTRSDTFRTLWAAHDVRTHGAGTKRFHHPVVGELTLAYEELAVTADPGTIMMIYTAEPGSPSAERLQLLASYAASEVAEF